MKIRLVAKKKAPPQPAAGHFVTGCPVQGTDAIVHYDTGAGEKVKVYLFDALGHFIADSAEPAGTLRIPDVRLYTEGDPHLYRLFVRLPDGSETIEEFAVRG